MTSQFNQASNSNFQKLLLSCLKIGVKITTSFDSYHAIYIEGFILSHPMYFGIYSTVLIIDCCNKQQETLRNF